MCLQIPNFGAFCYYSNATATVTESSFAAYDYVGPAKITIARKFN
jgi:hypothetical protein